MRLAFEKSGYNRAGVRLRGYAGIPTCHDPSKLTIIEEYHQVYPYWWVSTQVSSIRPLPRSLLGESGSQEQVTNVSNYTIRDTGQQILSSVRHLYYGIDCNSRFWVFRQSQSASLPTRMQHWRVEWTTFLCRNFYLRYQSIGINRTPSIRIIIIFCDQLPLRCSW